jgi:alanyl-tRNA synthetase
MHSPRPKYNYSRDAEGNYQFNTCTAKVLAIRKDNGFVDSVTASSDDVELGLVLDTTCFYAEQGGQASDRGTIFCNNNADIKLNDVQKRGPFVIHIGQLSVHTAAPFV